MTEVKEKRLPSLGMSLGIFGAIVLILIIGVGVLAMDIHILLSFGLIISCLGAWKLGFSLDDLCNAMGKSMAKAMVAMLIFVLIGTVIGSWIVGGTVPALIYYGLKFLNPTFFLPAGFIICSITSYATGTSWGTAGTVGLAMMGMGMGLGIPAPVVAGMVVSGAFFGDKMSPVSDTTVLAASSSDADMYDHINAMWLTTIPATIITIIIYTFLGFHYSNGAGYDSTQITTIQDILNSTFDLNPIVILPIVVVLVLSFLKVPSVPTLLIGTICGLLSAMIFQGVDFKSGLAALNYGYTVQSGNAMVDKLLIRGGIQNMMWTFSLAFIALCLGGVLEEVGYLKVIIESVLKNVKSAAGLVTVTMITSILGNAAMAEVYLSIILNGSLYKEAFEKKGLKKAMLSRILEEGATLSGPLIPWTTCGAFVAGALSVGTLEYLPFAFLCLINPILSLVLAYMNIFLLKEDKAEKNVAM